jgi:hypothetical protein
MTVEEAIKTATEYVKMLFGGTDHRLEEIEFHDGGDFSVTVSYRTNDAPRPLNLGSESFTATWFDTRGKKAAVGIDATRTYKDVLVSKDGQVKRVSMRQIVVG